MLKPTEGNVLCFEDAFRKNFRKVILGKFLYQNRILRIPDTHQVHIHIPIIVQGLLMNTNHIITPQIRKETDLALINTIEILYYRNHTWALLKLKYLKYESPYRSLSEQRNDRYRSRSHSNQKSHSNYTYWPTSIQLNWLIYTPSEPKFEKQLYHLFFSSRSSPSSSSTLASTNTQAKAPIPSTWFVNLYIFNIPKIHHYLLN